MSTLQPRGSDDPKSLLEFTAWSDPKKDLNLTKIEDLVQFFQRGQKERKRMVCRTGLIARLLPLGGTPEIS